MGDDLSPKYWKFDDTRYIARELDGEYVILNLSTSDYFTLNDTGCEVFKMLLEDKPLSRVQAEFEKNHPEAAPASASDIKRLIDMLCSKKIISRISVE